MDDCTKRLEERRISGEQIFDGVVLHVYFDEIALPNNEHATREYIKHVGAVCVIPVMDDNKVIMERQYRYPVGRVLYEIPAGKLNSKEEDRLEAAKRELSEETGYTADEWINLGEYLPAAAYSDERITMYMARGLHKGKQNLDEDEFLDVYEEDLSKLLSFVMNGTIRDGKTQVAIMKAANLLGVKE